MQVREKVKRKLYVPTRARVRRFLLYQGMVLFGAALGALGYVLFQVPFKLAAGGVSGLGIIINHYTGLPVGTLFMLVNLPLIVLGFFKLGRWPFVLSTITAVAGFSVAADLFVITLPDVMRNWPITDDALLAAVYAGILFGLGMGLVYRAGGSLGGSSIPARILHNATGFPLSQSFMITDLAIILAAGLVFRWEAALLAFLSLILAGIVSDFVMEGSSQVRTAMIVSEHPKELSYALMRELGRGVSMWSIRGAYTDADRTMLYCTVRRSQVVDLKYIVSKVDPKAFLVIGMAQQAWGGFGFGELKRNVE